MRVKKMSDGRHHPPHLFLDALDVAAAEGLHLAAQLEVAPDLLVVEDAEAVDHGDLAAGPPDHLIGVDGQVGRVAHGQHDGVGLLHGGPHVLLDAQRLELLLAVEEAGPAVAGVGVGVLIGVGLVEVTGNVTDIS